MKSLFKIITWGTVLSLSWVSCTLDELPRDTLVPENSYVNQVGFELGVNTIYNDFRVYTGTTEGAAIGFGFHMPDYMSVFSDVATGGQLNRNQLFDYRTLTPDHPAVAYYWDQAYSRMIKNSNAILTRAENPDIQWTSEADKNRILAEAKWFRSLAYRYLICLFGDVPWQDRESTSVKLDYEREKKETILDHIITDLEFSAAHLPADPDKVDEGRLTKAAANQLLAFCYLFKGNLTKDNQWYTRAEQVTSWIIDESGAYALMQGPFGDTPPDWRIPGDKNDPYPYLHWQDNTSRKKGNKETILVIGFQFNTPGGISGYSNQLVRRWGPSYHGLIDPDKKNMLLVDTIGRPINFVRPTDYTFETVWEGDLWNDLRNTNNNIRRDWYWNNKASVNYYGKKVDASLFTETDRHQSICPMLRKVEGIYTNIGAGVNDDKNLYYMRLSETYLLRAEARLMLGNPDGAAADINAVRARAKAKLVEAADVTIEYILDERCRELIIEEPRLLTLARLGRETLLSRIREHNFQTVSGTEMAGKTIQDHNWLWPIPQSAIDANLESRWENNPGYN